MIRMTVGLLALLAAAACAPTPNASGDTADSAAACAARGGELRRVGRLQTQQCVILYSDAGKRCTDSDQCGGECRLPDGVAAPAEGQAAVGQCTPDSDVFGCYTRVESGRAEPTICVD